MTQRRQRSIHPPPRGPRPRADWQILECRESPEALGGLGRACWWLDDLDAVSAARERAYHLYRDRGDASGAARVALHLAEGSTTFRAEMAVCNGWTERARRLLEDKPLSPGHAPDWILMLGAPPR